MKIIVYAICKNEEKFVNRWLKSMEEADAIYVLDTGSTDKTIELLKKSKKVHVKRKIIKPWRFDIARNMSLEMVPQNTNICVCTDLDETFNSGWRQVLESLWQKDTTRCNYLYNWALDENNLPIISFYYEKIHSRNNFKWIYPVHEILQCNKQENYIKTDKIILNHYPDSNKSRSNYLSLLELSVKEYPESDRNMHYLGREYMYHEMWNKAIDTLIKHTKMPQATWPDEKSASMRFISRCYIHLNRYDEAILWINKAITEAPYLRDPYVEKAFILSKFNDNKGVIKNLNKALKIKENNHTYINEPFSWNETIYDLLSIAYYNIGKFKLAYKNVKKALKIKPNDKRIQNNLIIIKKNIA
jgi:tetratricopeptide (TPR) repeat protein